MDFLHGNLGIGQRQLNPSIQRRAEMASLCIAASRPIIAMPFILSLVSGCLPMSEIIEEIALRISPRSKYSKARALHQLTCSARGRCWPCTTGNSCSGFSSGIGPAPVQGVIGPVANLVEVGVLGPTLLADPFHGLFDAQQPSQLAMQPPPHDLIEHPPQRLIDRTGHCRHSGG